MKVIGLTGGIGMGKSTAAELLHSRGVSVVDTDNLSRDLVQPGQPALAEIQSAFGPDILDGDGRLLREKLAGIVFADERARARLESILHPRIAELWQEQMRIWREEGRASGVVVIPLLFETGVEAQFDAIVCVACSGATQRQRLERRGWTALEVAQRNAAQLPVVEKMARSKFVVWSEGDTGVVAEQLARIVPMS